MTARLRLVYLGNLGLAHDVPLLCEFLVGCRLTGEVSLTFFGTAESSLTGLKGFARREGIRIESRSHIEFTRLKEVLPPLGFDFGLVTLAEKFAGLLSPSKFAGYLAAGLPLVYLGPPETNVALVCDRFGAGLRLDRSGLRAGGLANALPAIFEEERHRRFARGVVAAAQYFDQFNGAHLAREVLRRSRLAAE